MLLGHDLNTIGFTKVCVRAKFERILSKNRWWEVKNEYIANIFMLCSAKAQTYKEITTITSTQKVTFQVFSTNSILSIPSINLITTLPTPI